MATRRNSTKGQKATPEELGHVGLFADSGTNMKRANEVVEAYAKASGEAMVVFTACYTYHNTFIKYLLKNYNVTRKG